MPIGDYCRRNPVSASRQETLREAARKMAAEAVGSLVVLSGDRVAGVVTDRDVALATLAQGRDPDATRLAELVDENAAVVVHEDSALGVAAGMMRRHAIRRLPVLDANEQLIGVIASDDLLRIVAGEIGGLARTVEAQTPDRTREMPIGDVSGPEVE